MANQLIDKIDRKNLAELIAAYLYFKSKGRTESEFQKFILSQEMPALLSFVASILPVVVPALLVDKTFRKMVLDIVMNSVAGEK